MRTRRLLTRQRAVWLNGENGIGPAGTIADTAAISMGAGVNWTVTGWMSSLSNFRPVVLKGTSTTVLANIEYMLATNNGGVAGGWARSSDGATLTSSNGATRTYPLGKRCFYAGYFDGTNIGDYQNDSTALTAALVTGSQDGTNALALGNISATGGPINGMIARVGIWKRALTAIEVLRLYNGGRGCLAREMPSDMWANIVEYWDLSVDGRGYFNGIDWVWSGKGVNTGGWAALR